MLSYMKYQLKLECFRNVICICCESNSMILLLKHSGSNVANNKLAFHFYTQWDQQRNDYSAL